MITFHSYGVDSPPAELKPVVLGIIEAVVLGPMLSHAVEAPSPRLKRSVMAAVELQREQATQPAQLVGRGPRRTQIARFLAAAAMLLIGVIAGVALGPDEPPGQDVAQGPNIPEGHETQILEVQGMGPPVVEVRHYRHDNFRLTLSVEGYEATPVGFHYAVWVRGEPGDVGIGTFRLKRSDDFEIPFAVGVNPTEYPDILVTLEPNDGDPALTGDVVSEAHFDLETVHHGGYNP
ncbi:MAG: anti-sigma factor [Actinobacteria bacterium]|nr:anti-sigma factor [Actinomycetota bacterium]